MSRIDDLLHQDEPKGVDYVQLGQLLHYEQPTKYLVSSKSYDDSYTTPVLTAGQTFLLGYTKEADGIYPASVEEPVIIFDDFTTAFKWVDFPFKVKSSAMKILTPKQGVSLRYVWFAMQTIRYEPKDHARQWIGTYSAFRVPVPDLDVQSEIVATLDTFKELEVELEAELRSRKEQYAYHRDTLLSLGELGSVEWAPLSELGDFYSGLSGKSKSDFAGGNAPFIPYMSVFSSLVVDTVPRTFVKVGPDERQTAIAYGDVLFTSSSESRNEVGMASAVTSAPSQATYLNSFCFGFRPNSSKSLNPEFAKHLFRSRVMREQIVKTANGVTRINISRASFRKIVVPLLGVDEQLQIASVLDNFEALVNGAEVGIPAEIEARGKQYAHYRDLILSFGESNT